MAASQPLVLAAQTLIKALKPLTFGEPITHVYNPLEYAWKPHETYLKRFGGGGKKIVFLGMNPGPWGMAQTGVPFGEIAAVRDWMGITASVTKPVCEHPKRPIEGFACEKSEVSGRRLWGLFSQRFPQPESFFAEHFVANYCPLVFMSVTGANVTPDKLPAAEARVLGEACDAHLVAVIEALKPQWVIGVGDFARNQAMKHLGRFPTLKVGKILHPSPASPAANRDWPGQAMRQMQELKIW
jgi:single-strand selective monofunctional uracil DNA glycosylase